MKLLLALLFLGGPLCGLARADAIGPPPACPPGTWGTSSHMGQSCTAANCKTDEDCTGSNRLWERSSTSASTCKDWRVCTYDREVQSHSRRADVEPRTYTETYVIGTCDPSEECTGLEEAPAPGSYRVSVEEITCTTAKYCVPDALPALPRIAPPVEEKEQSEDEDKGDSKPEGSSTCGCSPGMTGSVSLALMGLLGGLSLVRRRES